MAILRHSSLARVIVYSLVPSLLVSAQVVPGDVPPPVVKEHGDQVRLQGDASACELVCASIAQAFPEQLYLAADGNLDYWDAKQQENTPACRVEPTTAEEVSTIVKTLVKEQCHFAIKSGGHSRHEGDSSAGAGVTIDLARMKTVDVGKDKKTAKVGAGARWLDVYTSVEKEGLMVVGGRVADVGVGGLTLGGGISFFSARRGWACDGVAAFEIVLADGSIVNVTHASHPDLFFALRGSSNNFGVVTAFTFETFEQGNLWGGSRMYSQDKYPALLDAYHEHTTTENPDLDAMGYDTFGYLQSYDMMFGVIQLMHTKPEIAIKEESEFPESYAAYEKIEPMPGTEPLKVAQMSQFTAEIAAVVPQKVRNWYKTLTIRPNREFYAKALDIFMEELSPVKNITGILPVVYFQPITPAILRLMERNGGNALGIADQADKGGLTIMGASWTWKDAADDEVVVKALDNVFDRSEKVAKEMNIYHPFIYQNYASKDQDVFLSYGEKNYKRLQKIQKSVDPDGVFAKGGLCGGYHKINEKEDTKRVKDEL